MNSSKTTMVLGASTNPERYSYKAITSLKRHNHQVLAIGMKSGKVEGVEILHTIPSNEKIHTVSLYLGSTNQAPYFNDIIQLKPERVIFNPGTENEEFQELLTQNNINFEESCTLVLLSTGQY